MLIQKLERSNGEVEVENTVYNRRRLDSSAPPNHTDPKALSVRLHIGILCLRLQNFMWDICWLERT